MNEQVEIITPEIVHQSYTNAFNILVGITDFDTLSEQDEFYLPQDHDDVNIFFRSISNVIL